VIGFLEKIKEELDVFNQQFQAALSTKAVLLHRITNYVNQSPGKKIRPICTILSAGLINNISEKTYRGAVLVELLHTATLIHDDIVDDAQLRRSALSINAIWKNKIAVLTGDYFLAKGLKLAVQYEDYDILSLISNVVQEIVEGELIQIEKTKKLNLKEEDLYKIISLKTGSLFETSFLIGTLNSNSDIKTIENLKTLGMNIGLLFQIKDDILDYTSKSLISGKSFGNDIKEGKINFPLLLSLNKMTLMEKQKVYSILRSKKTTTKEIYSVYYLIKKYKGIELADTVVKRYYSESKTILTNFEENIYKEVLQSLLDYLIERKK
tara:strand:- start:92 stop:1060 length:969 start_codon:yes stop_codon:yes gene_type:complete